MTQQEKQEAPKSPSPKTIDTARKAELSGACVKQFSDASAEGADEDFKKTTDKLKNCQGEDQAKDAVRAQRVLSGDTGLDGSSMGGGRIATNNVSRLVAGGSLAEQEKERKKKLNAVLKLSRDIAKRIAELDSKIADYDRKIRTMEEDIFTPEELAELDKLSPEERFKKAQEDMKEKVANGDITQAQYDQWLIFNQERDAARIERDHVQSEFDQTKGLKGQEKVNALQKIVNENNIDAVRQERHILEEEAKEQVEVAIWKKDDDGVVYKQEAQDTFDSFLDDTEMLGETSQTKSFASEIASNSGFETKLCPIKTAFNTASQNCEELEKDVIISVDKDFDTIKLS